MSKKNTKTTPTRVKRQRKRRLLTLMRIFHYGTSNFSRNIWLTVAATAVMAITLLIIFMTLTARNVLLETIANISRDVDMSVYFRSDAPEEDILTLQAQMEQLDNVESVRYISSADAREEQAQQYKDDPSMLEAIREASNRMSATLRVSLVDINDTTSLDAFISESELYEDIKDPTKEEPFQGENRATISTIGEWVRLAEIGGGVMTTVFVIISSLVVFNTIRMAIFNRKDEIQMMKLIGAERSFIRGPFLVEAVMYGFIAAIIASAVGFALVYTARQPLADYGLPIESTIQMMISYSAIIVLGMIIVGAFIGVVSSYIATRRYLKL